MRKLELEKKHKRGTRTFFFIFIQKCWLLALIGLGFFYLAGSIYWGNLRQPTEQFLTTHADWYVSVGMLAEWFFLVGISFFIVGYLRASVLYRTYKFYLDEYAVHLRRGLFYIRETTIPYHQISNVHIGRPYHYRMLGLAQLDIVTAADRSDDRLERSSKKFLMPVIDVSLARILSRQLLESAAESRRYGHLITNENDNDPTDEDDDEEEYDKEEDITNEDTLERT